MNTSDFIFGKKLLLLFSLVSLLFCSCKNNDYYIDGGTSVAEFNGTALQYLQSKPANFDTIVTIIKLAGLEQVLSNDTVTVFTPQDYSVKKLIQYINPRLFSYGKDTIKKLDDITPVIWKKYFSNYLYKGANRAKDYPQVDFLARGLYPGQDYLAYSKEIFNIGVTYADVGTLATDGTLATGVKYAGYRQLNISYIPNTSKPLEKLITSSVTSSDIQPYHSVVHVLSSSNHTFGFDPANFFQDVLLSKQ